MTLVIRSARAGDEDAIHRLLLGLAEYEKLVWRFHVTHADVKRDYLCDDPLIHAELAFDGDEAVGLATWFWTYAGFAARRGLYLEDFFVLPACRGKGYGTALMAHLCRIAREAGAIRVDWNVLDWNAPSIAYYERLGAKRHEGSYYYRLEGEAMRKLME
ncbi:MAG: GNAT family N-acetyltransferase [Alphaproteobacteria bacterium]|nr:GNAT family N-acetyltransferase [Alphaproteobacteria bacterium]